MIIAKPIFTLPDNPRRHGGGSTLGMVLKFLLALALVLCIALPSQTHAQAGRSTAHFATGHILVKPRNAVNDADFGALIGRHGGRDYGSLRATRMHIVTVEAGQEESAIQALALAPEVEYAELDRLVEPETTTANDPNYGNAWHLATLGAPTAWDVAKGSGVTVAILDSGIDGTHPDLVGNLVAGWNLVDNNSNTSDVYGHGTEVAGVVGALSNNGIGVTSIAWQTQLMPVRVAQTSGSAYISTIASGITWAADHGARIANASFATLTGSPSIQSAANYMRSKGGLVVVSAGNSGTLDTTTDSTAVISVSATTSSDALASWSSYGSYIDVAAPGSGIWTTKMGGGYAPVSGTSFSSPVTAGVLALMMSANPTLSNNDLETLLKNSAVDLGTPGYDQYYGHGRIDAAAAVDAATKFGVTIDTESPTASINAPTGGTVSSTIVVTAGADDNVGVARVELYAGTTLLGTSTTAPYTFTWDTTSTANGDTSLQVHAYDEAGNRGSSASVTVTVSNTSTVVSSPGVNVPDQQSGNSGGSGGGGGTDIQSVIGLLAALLASARRGRSIRRTITATVSRVAARLPAQKRYSRPAE